MRSSQPPDTFLKGVELGAYRIESLIATGPRGPSYRARCRKTDRLVVLKVLTSRETRTLSPDRRKGWT